MDIENQILAIRDRGARDEQIAALRQLQDKAMRDLRAINNGIQEVAEYWDAIG